VWNHYIESFARKYKLIVYDHRGHGRSDKPEGNYSIKTLASDLNALTRKLDLGKVTLIGHSMGGKVAMNFALEYPQRIDKLIVVDMSVRPYPARKQHMDIMSAMLSINFDEVDSREEVERIIVEKVKSPRISQFVLKNLYRIGKKRLAWRLNIEDIYNNIENVFEGIESPYSFDNPSLFVRGGASDYILDKDYDLIKKNFPQAQFKTIEGASHWVHADAPDELCMNFSEFLEKACDYNPGK
jgi:pimeloyl-ACP methyl ester carboxylesterase